MPILQRYQNKWQIFQEARRLSVVLNRVKSEAILHQHAREAIFSHPDTVEIVAAESCTIGQKRDLISRLQLNEGVVFRSSVDTTMDPEWDSKEIILSRFCYDPRFGSSLHSDGIARGVIALSPVKIETQSDMSQVVKLILEGPFAEISIE